MNNEDEYYRRTGMNKQVNIFLRMNLQIIHFSLGAARAVHYSFKKTKVYFGKSLKSWF
jgi:hypothetical protein